MLSRSLTAFLVRMMRSKRMVRTFNRATNWCCNTIIAIINNGYCNTIFAIINNSLGSFINQPTDLSWASFCQAGLKDIFYVTDGNIMYLTDASWFLISCVIQHYAPVVGWGGEVGGWRNRCIMLIMTLDPSWRQTLRMPPPGIEPGSPASQTGHLRAQECPGPPTPHSPL